MNMLRFLNEVSPWVVALVIVAAAEIYSIGLMLLCRRRWGTDRLSLNNEVAGFKFAVIGVFYAVLLAFVVVAVWGGLPGHRGGGAQRGQGARRSSSSLLRAPRGDKGATSAAI